MSLQLRKRDFDCIYSVNNWLECPSPSRDCPCYNFLRVAGPLGVASITQWSNERLLSFFNASLKWCDAVIIDTPILHEIARYRDEMRSPWSDARQAHHPIQPHLPNRLSAWKSLCHHKTPTSRYQRLSNWQHSLYPLSVYLSLSISTPSYSRCSWSCNTQGSH